MERKGDFLLVLVVFGCAGAVMYFVPDIKPNIHIQEEGMSGISVLGVVVIAVILGLLIKGLKLFTRR